MVIPIDQSSTNILSCVSIKWWVVNHFLHQIKNEVVVLLEVIKASSSWLWFIICMKQHTNTSSSQGDHTKYLTTVVKVTRATSPWSGSRTWISNMDVHCELVVLFLALTLTCQVHTGRIFGGHMVKPHSRPYMVLVKQLESEKFCGGCILSEDFVMTAAHCDSRSYLVYVGLDSINNKTDVQEILVKQKFRHKDFNGKTFTHDIMLLKLSSKVKFNNNVRTLDLADQGDDSLPKSCRVAGWGISKNNQNNLTNSLMEVDVELIEYEDCERNSLFCSEGDSGPRRGDSGGPLVCEGDKAYGVVSASHKPHNGDPLMYWYTNIPEHRTWIDRTMKNAGKL